MKVAHLVIGVDAEGPGHALGVWIAEAEGAKFWHSVLTALHNRGLRDITDGLLVIAVDGKVLRGAWTDDNGQVSPSPR